MKAFENFVGREKELKDLKIIYKKSKKMNKAMLIGIDGIRKVGKTTFVQKFILDQSQKNKEVINFSFIGNLKLQKRQNISIMIKEIEKKIKTKLIEKDLEEKYKNKVGSYFSQYSYHWMDFFNYLEKNINFLKENIKGIEIYLFFDEISWFDKQKQFIAYFANFWNQYAYLESDLFIFMASSVSTWINEVAFYNNGPLFERFNMIIKLNPFNIKEIKDIILLQNPNISKVEIIFYYFIFGGIIKYYLNNAWINFNLSFEENMKLLSTENKKFLIKEYNELFVGILSEKKQYKEIVFALCSLKSGNQNEIKEKIKKEYGLIIENNNLYKQLKDLIDYDFVKITKSPNNFNENIYMINHLLSYFVYYWLNDDLQDQVKVKKHNIVNKKEKIYKINFLDNDFSTWKGMALEIFLLNNIDLLNEELELNNVDYYLNWKYFEQIKEDKTSKIKNQKVQKAQIDLLIEKTRDLKRIEDDQAYFTIVECKNYKEKEDISYSEIRSLKNKKIYVEDFYLKLLKKKINIDFVIFTVNPLSKSNLSSFEENFENIKNIALKEII